VIEQHICMRLNPPSVVAPMSAIFQLPDGMIVPAYTDHLVLKILAHSTSTGAIDFRVGFTCLRNQS